MNYIILNDKIITSKYVLDMLDVIYKAKNKKEVKITLFDELQKLILQGKITFGYVYTDNEENQLRGRVGRYSGFRHGTQRLDLIPNNKWPKSRSNEQTCLRYYDFGRMDWRSFKKDLFVVATSFWNDKTQKWVDNPVDAGFTTNWNKIKNLNKLEDYVHVDRPDTPEEASKRAKIKIKEEEKRDRQINENYKKSIKKSFNIENGIIRIN